MSRNITGEVQIALPMDEIAAFCRRWDILGRQIDRSRL